MNNNPEFTFAFELPLGEGQTLAWGSLRLDLLSQPGQLWVWHRWEAECTAPALSAWSARPQSEPERLARPEGQELRAQVCLPQLPLLLRFSPQVSIGAKVTWAFRPVVPLWIAVQAGNQTLGQWAAHPVRRCWVGPDTRHGEMGFALDQSPPPGTPLSALGQISAHNATKHLLQIKTLAYPIHRLGLKGTLKEPRFGAAAWHFETAKQAHVQLDKPPANPLLAPTLAEESAYRNLMPSLLK